MNKQTRVNDGADDDDDDDDGKVVMQPKCGITSL